jgi:hypothetical protein
VSFDANQYVYMDIVEGIVRDSDVLSGEAYGWSDSVLVFWEDSHASFIVEVIDLSKFKVQLKSRLNYATTTNSNYTIGNDAARYFSVIWKWYKLVRIDGTCSKTRSSRGK